MVMLLLFDSIFLVSEKPLVLTSGFVTDLTMGVLKSGGYDVKSVNPTDMRGYVNQFQESMIETAVTQHAICLVNGLEKVDSFLDNDLSLGDRFTFDGTSYTFSDGRILSQDFRFQTRVRRNVTGQVIYDPTTVCLPALISTGPAYTTTVTQNAIGMYNFLLILTYFIFKFMMTHLYYQL